MLFILFIYQYESFPKHYSVLFKMLFFMTLFSLTYTSKVEALLLMIRWFLLSNNSDDIGPFKNRSKSERRAISKNDFSCSICLVPLPGSFSLKSCPCWIKGLAWCCQSLSFCKALPCNILRQPLNSHIAIVNAFCFQSCHLYLRTLNRLTNGKLVCADTPVPSPCYGTNITYTGWLLP